MNPALLPDILDWAARLAGPGVVIALVVAWVNRKKLNADTEETRAKREVTLSGGAMEMVDRLQRSADNAEHRAEVAERKADACRAEISRLWDALDAFMGHIRVLEDDLEEAGVHVPARPRVDLPGLGAPPSE